MLRHLETACEYPQAHLADYTGIIQADAYAGYNALLKPDRVPAPLKRAFCWAHARRYFFELADIAANAKRRKGAANISRMALEAVQRIDRVFEIERDLGGNPADARRDMRQQLTAPIAPSGVAFVRHWRRIDHAADHSGHIFLGDAR